MVDDLPFELLCPPTSNFEISWRCVWELVGFSQSKVVLEGSFYVGLDFFPVRYEFEVEWFRLIVDLSAPFTCGDCSRPER